jgi:hypothetical protein
MAAVNLKVLLLACSSIKSASRLKPFRCVPAWRSGALPRESFVPPCVNQIGLIYGTGQFWRIQGSQAGTDNMHSASIRRVDGSAFSILRQQIVEPGRMRTEDDERIGERSDKHKKQVLGIERDRLALRAVD